MKTLLAAIGGLLLIVMSSIWYGYVLSIVWGWFMTPVLHAPTLSIPAAIGISSVVRLMTSQQIEENGKEKSTSERWLGIFLRSFFLPAFVLFSCWIVKHWM
jgi:hypothetical protein